MATKSQKFNQFCFFHKIYFEPILPGAELEYTMPRLPNLDVDCSLFTGEMNRTSKNEAFCGEFSFNISRGTVCTKHM